MRTRRRKMALTKKTVEMEQSTPLVRPVRTMSVRVALEHFFAPSITVPQRLRHVPLVVAVGAEINSIGWRGRW